MKIYNKNDLTYKNGYIICDDKVVSIDNEIVDLLNKLDTDIQRAEWRQAKSDNAHEAWKEAMSQFEPKSEFTLPEIGAETPVLDAKIEEAKMLMDDIDAKAYAAQANDYLAGIKPVVLFVQDDSVVEFEQPTQHRFDLPVVGNPLELDGESLALLVCRVYHG